MQASPQGTFRLGNGPNRSAGDKPSAKSVLEARICAQIRLFENCGADRQAGPPVAIVFQNPAEPQQTLRGNRRRRTVHGLKALNGSDGTFPPSAIWSSPGAPVSQYGMPSAAVWSM